MKQKEHMIIKFLSIKNMFIWSFLVDQNQEKNKKRRFKKMKIELVFN
jgi:hypothetical protein